MRIDVPDAALVHGFVNEPVGTHTSRTIMLREFTKVLAEAASALDAGAIKEIAITHNAVEKASAAGRAKTYRHLRELYGMDPRIEVFRSLRVAWGDAGSERPLLAVLCAMARDPVLRATAAVVTRMREGDSVSSAALADEVSTDFPGRYSTGVTARIGRNIASSWTQAGLVTGKSVKFRRAAEAGPISLAYAMYLAHLTGVSGKRLLDTAWTSILDRSPGALESLAERASRQGWIDYRASGGMVDVTFRHLAGASGA